MTFNKIFVGKNIFDKYDKVDEIFEVKYLCQTYQRSDFVVAFCPPKCVEKKIF
jgi:hypothetical protein